MKKIALALVAVTLSIIMVIAGAYAWYFSEDNVDNAFAVGNFDVILNEVFDGWNQKRVTVANTGDIPALVRVSAIPVLYIENGNDITYLDTDGLFTFDYPSDFDVNWFPKNGESLDGWFYCTFAVTPGQEVVFLEKVGFNKANDDAWWAAHPEYKDAKLDVVVTMESAPVTEDYSFTGMWDLNSYVEGMLKAICDAYFGG